MSKLAGNIYTLMGEVHPIKTGEYLYISAFAESQGEKKNQHAKETKLLLFRH